MSAMSEVQKKWSERGGVAVLLVALILQCGFSMRLKSPVVDEFVHLPVGLSLWKHGDFLTDPINPPFMRMWAAIPLLFRDVKWTFPQERMREQYWPGAYQFMRDNSGDYQSLFISARWMVVLLSLLLAGTVFWWARSLYGRRAGLLALFLYSFCPNILAHSRLVTADLGGACFVFLSMFHFWRWRRSNCWGHLAGWAIFLGMALLSKLTAVFLPLFMLVVWVVSREGGELEDGRSIKVQLISAIGFTLLVLNLGYAFQGSFRILSSYSFKSGIGNSVQGIVGFLPVPLPEGFVQGIDHALRHDKDLMEDSFYLLGELSSVGWWYYFVVAWVLKIPLASLFGQGACAFIRVRRLVRRESLQNASEEWFLWVPAVGIFCAISIFSSLNIGFRHVLPALPFVFVLVSSLASYFLSRPGAVALCFACIWYLVSALFIFPNHLAYFNELGGGPAGGRQYLVDSNLDWGQDLIQLRDFLSRRGNPRIKLAYFGRTDPKIYGIDFEPLKPSPEPGLIVISASFLQGRPYLYPLPSDTQPYALAPARQFIWLQDYEPVAHIGYSLLVFEIRGQQP
ncbi:MAG: glycosyltransferase family 39 protein [Planctomycetota bacterium]|nr:glycosyltransferase family 39 protein [Planctomycetota bacterium]